MENQSCPVCEAHKYTETDEWKERRHIWKCKHFGEDRFIFYGSSPKNLRELDKIRSTLARAFKLAGKPGPKPQKKKRPDLYQLSQALSKLPTWNRNQKLLATQLNISISQLREILKKAGSSWAELKYLAQGTEPDKSRLVRRPLRKRLQKTRRNKST